MAELKSKQEREQAGEERSASLADYLSSPVFQEIALGITRDPQIVKRIVGVALRQIHEVKNLDQCSPRTFIACVLEAATLGLEIGMSGECWIIPYETPKRSGNFEAQLQIGYLGHLALAWRSEKIAGLQVDVVCEGDTFDFVKGTEGFIRHRPRDGRIMDAASITHVYAVLKTVYGGLIWDVFDKEWIESIRRFAPSGDSPAWVDHYAAMAKGKALKNIAKYAPKSREMARAITVDDQSDAGLRQTFSHDVMALPERSSRGQTLDEAKEASPQDHREPEPAERATAKPAEKTAAVQVEPSKQPSTGDLGF